MRMKIWGARGSIPTPMTTLELRTRLREVLERSRGVNVQDPAAVERYIDRLPPYLNTVASGNTTCLELHTDQALFIFDMGSGIRLLGKELMQQEFGQGQGEAHILLSHSHWDHAEGYPFFSPAYVPGNQLNFYAPFENIEWRLHHMMRPPFFPVDLGYQRATRTFNQLEMGVEHSIADAKIQVMELKHPGTCYAYRVEQNGKIFVYATDAEYSKMDKESTTLFENFFRDADVLFFDAMYTYEDAVTSKVDWGHSTAKVGAELAWRAGVKQLLLSHHDPDSTEQQLWQKVDDADQHLRRKNARGESRHVDVRLAYEGLTIEW